MHNISVISPMFNEEDSISLLVSNFIKLSRIAPKEWVIDFILVDDGSKDNTLDMIARQNTSGLSINVLKHLTNQGFGAAMRTGIEYAKGNIIVCYDADSTYPVEDVIRLVNKIHEGFDVASGNPFVSETILVKVPIWRQFLTRANAMAYKLVLGKMSKNITLFSCAFRAYKSDVIKPIKFRSNGFGAASEVLGRLIIHGNSVVEISSELSVRKFGVSKMNVRKAVTEHLRNIILFTKIRFLNY